MLSRTKLSSSQLEKLGTLLPMPEPKIGKCSSGPRSGDIYPVAETRLVGNERRYLNECIDTNWLSSRGPFVSQFERAFAREAECTHGVSCASGTVALHLVLAALGIGPGDEVIVPSFTMIASANAVRYTGATVVLVDVEADHLNIDPALVEAAITPRTKAIVVVHAYGHPADMDALVRIAKERNIDLIEDAAEAHGAEYAARRAGSFGTASTFSFYANKIITTGEGGMVCTNDERLAALVRCLRDHAFSQERHFWHEYLGFNYRMTNLQAAIGLAQTERLGDIVEARRRLHRDYCEALRDIPGCELPYEEPFARSAFWMYGLRLDPDFGCSRDVLRRELADRGIETRTFFVPLHIQPIYFEAFSGQSFPVSEAASRTGLYLPTSERLGTQDARWIADQVADIHALHREKQAA